MSIAKSFQIKNHRLDGIEYKATPNKGGALNGPSAILMHDTAGGSAASSVSWLCNPAAKASAHLVVGRDGSVVQLAPFNVVTWHAGRSKYRGRRGCNAFMIGIEHENPGKLSADGRSWFNERYQGFEHASTPQHGDGYWLPYTEAQLAATMGIVIALRGKYPSLSDVVGHWLVSPGRKFDTNPLFPMEAMLTALQGRSLGADPDDDDTAPYGIVTVDSLNLRRWPSNADNIVRELAFGDRVEIIRSGFYADGFPHAKWYFVESSDGVNGWVHSAYVDEHL